MNKTDIEFYNEAVSSPECQCQAWKKPGLPLCYVCYKKSDHIDFFKGSITDKAEAYDEAVKFLNE